MTRLKNLAVVVGLVCLSKFAFAKQSTITSAEGYACMNEDRTKRQTEELALSDAKKKAMEQVSVYLKSQLEAEASYLRAHGVSKDFESLRQMIEAMSSGDVRIIEQEGRWDNDPPKVGDCYRVRIKAEVTPDEEAMKKKGMDEALDNPAGPLKIKVWTEKGEYKKEEKVKIFLKGNKPFYARILYKQADGTLVQILPNPYRKDNYFQGGIVYEVPSGPDRFDLVITPPFGEEEVIVYASTSELGNIQTEEAGAVYKVKTDIDSASTMTRGIKLQEKGSTQAGEFVEERVEIKAKR